MWKSNYMSHVYPLEKRFDLVPKANTAIRSNPGEPDNLLRFGCALSPESATLVWNSPNHLWAKM